MLIICEEAGKRYIYFSLLRSLGQKCYLAQDAREAETCFLVAERISIVVFFLAGNLSIKNFRFWQLLIRILNYKIHLVIIGELNEASFLAGLPEDKASNLMLVTRNSNVGLPEIIEIVEEQINSNRYEQKFVDC